MEKKPTKTTLDKLINAELSRMMKEDPVKINMFLLLNLGRQCVDANVGTLTINQEHNIKKFRYKTTAVITCEKIGEAK